MASVSPDTSALLPPPPSSSTPSASALAPPPVPSPTKTHQPTPAHQALPKLERLPPNYYAHHAFLRPVKSILDGPDVSRFLVSKAYRDIGLFILQLNHALCPRTTTAPGSALPTASTTTLFTLQSPKRSDDPPSVKRLQELLKRIADFIDEAPPDPGPRRFGNASFRTWHKLLRERVGGGLLEEYVVGVGASKPELSEPSEPQPLDEVKEYFLGSFGSAQRLDYGTGHELSFLAFLGCLWKLGLFSDGNPGDDGEAVERSIVLGVIEPYLHVVRKLILTYTLEPAGSHGVWGLDDHSFLPYVFGSAQLTRPISGAATADGSKVATEAMPQDGSAPRVPKPSDILKPTTVEVQRQLNMYFSAIGFIDDVKKGPFWEHSPILFDVSGIKDGWGKINKGMIKMFNAEVLSKFPVVQHFPFGSLFSWEEDPDAAAPVQTVHMANQPLAAAATAAALQSSPSATPTASAATAAPSAPMPPTAAPWAQATRMPGAGPSGLPGPGIPYSRVPASPASAFSAPGGPRLARPGGYPATSAAPARVPPTLSQPPSQNQTPGGGNNSASAESSVTRAPWAK